MAKVTAPKKDPNADSVALPTEIITAAPTRKEGASVRKSNDASPTPQVAG